jgi:hypothetical protein
MLQHYFVYMYSIVKIMVYKKNQGQVSNKNCQGTMLAENFVNSLPGGPLAPPLTGGPRSDWT